MQWLVGKLRQQLVKITADTLALFLFSVSTGILGLLFERFVVSLSLVQMASIRFIYNVVKFGFARVLGKIADSLRAKLLGSSKHPLRRALADGLALSAYQIPIYALCALALGAKPGQVGLSAAFYFVNNLSVGWIYGLWLNWVRAWFAVRPPEV